MRFRFQISHLLVLVVATAIVFCVILWTRSSVPTNAWRTQFSSSIQNQNDHSNTIYWYRAFGRADSPACIVVLVKTETTPGWSRLDFDKQCKWYATEGGKLKVGGRTIPYPTDELIVFAGDLNRLLIRKSVDKNDSIYFKSKEDSVLYDFPRMNRLWQQVVGDSGSIAKWGPRELGEPGDAREPPS